MKTYDYPQPHVLPHGSWNRRLHGPWQLIVQSVRTGEVLASAPTNYLEAAIGALIESDAFPQRMTRAVIVDADGWIVFGVSTDPAYIEKMGHTCWFGSEIGFATLEASGLVDQMDLTIWEGIARNASDSDSWWQAET